MTGPAIRSRLLEIGRTLGAARLGRQLLDSKREAIVHELARRARPLREMRATVDRALLDARMAMDEAIVEIGPSAVDAATLAQPIVATVERRVTSVAGVRMPRLSAAAASFRPQYGMGGTAATLDVAGSRMSQLVRALVSLADIEAAVAFLEAGLAQTIRRLRALDQIVIPNLERERRAVAAAIEEEERDEALRRKLWLETQPPPIPGLFASGARSPSAISHG